MNGRIQNTSLITIMFAGFLAPVSAMSADADIRLVLQITIDGLRPDRITLAQPAFGEGGFNKLFAEGAVFTNAHYGHANTETIVGHATLATGAHPSAHGMTGNVWHDAEADELSYNIEDPESLPLPTRKTARSGDQVDPAQRLARTTGRSPRALLAETLADTMIASFGEGTKVFAVSNKDRSAVAMGGQGGKALWYSTDTGDFGTTTYYYDSYPTWVREWNEGRRAEQLAGSKWSLLDDAQTYHFADQDDRPYETDLRGFGRVFPHRYGDANDPLLFTQVVASPAGDVLLASFAKSLIENESLGSDDSVDYLSVSFSGVDAVNHFFGASSLEMEDMVRQLDRTLADFLAYVDKRVGLDHVLLVLSADHGSAEAPEYIQSQGRPAGRLYPSAIIDATNRLALETFDIDGVVKYYYRPYVYLREDLIDEAGLDFVTVREKIAAHLTAEPGVHAAVTLLSNRLLDNKELANRIRNNYHPNRAGDIYIVQDLHWFNFDPGPVAVMHGSPWSYDTHVPIIFFGTGVKAGMIDRRVQPVDVAPTLAALLGILPPASAQGSVLSEVFE